MAGPVRVHPLKPGLKPGLEPERLTLRDAGASYDPVRISVSGAFVRGNFERGLRFGGNLRPLAKLYPEPLNTYNPPLSARGSRAWNGAESCMR